MVEDVTTSGKSIDETYPMLKAAADVEVKGYRVAQPHGGRQGRRRDRPAGDPGEIRFPRRVHREHGRGREHLNGREVDGRVVIDDATKAALDAYYEQYGVKA